MKLGKIVGITVAFFITALAASMACVAHSAALYQKRLGRPLERELGFRHGSPYIIAGDDSFEVFTLHPGPGGALELSGVRDGDIVLNHSITGFYRALHEHRGSVFIFCVVAGGDGLPIAERPVRPITLHVTAQRPTNAAEPGKQN